MNLYSISRKDAVEASECSCEYTTILTGSLLGRYIISIVSVFKQQNAWKTGCIMSTESSSEFCEPLSYSKCFYQKCVRYDL